MSTGTSGTEPQPAQPCSPASEERQVERELNRADIILTRGGGLTSWVIRFFTRSYWNHAAMVFVLSDDVTQTHQGYRKTFILEAEPHGIDAHPIDKYLCKKGQDMVILRFPESALPTEQRRVDFLRRVRGFAFEEIDAVYSYPTLLRILERIVGPLGCLIKPLIRALRIITSFNRPKAINDFVCSGAVQYAYYRSTRGEDPDDGSRWDSLFQNDHKLDDLIVSPKIQAEIDHDAPFQVIQEQLEVTTPADFSKAVARGLLECVAERTKGVWRDHLTQD